MRLLFVIGIVGLYVAINSGADQTPHNVIDILSEYQKKESEKLVADLVRKFSSKYFQKTATFLYEDQVISPLSVFIPMSILSYGTRGPTRNKFLSAIQLPKSKARMAKYGFYMFLKKLAMYNVSTTTRMFVPSGVRMNPHFINFITKVFNSDIEAVDNIDEFPDRKYINEWVGAQTNNNVIEFLKPKNIGRGTSFVLVNTIYLKGTWKKAFDSSGTAPRIFYAFGGDPVTVPTMYTAGFFQHGRIEALRASFIELPYKSNGEGNGMSMFIILPDGDDSEEWTNLTMNLKRMNLNRLLNSTKKEVEVFLPKFKVKAELSLNELFRSISLNKDPANFSAIFHSVRQSNFVLSTSKLVIEVDEEGEEAADSSGMFYKVFKPVPSCRRVRSRGTIAARSITRKVQQFKVDRPFVAMIVIKGEILTDIFSINFLGSGFTLHRRYE